MDEERNNLDGSSQSLNLESICGGGQIFVTGLIFVTLEIIHNLTTV